MSFCGCGGPKFLVSGESVSSQLVSLFEHVLASGLPNYRCCRIPVLNSGLKIHVWRERLVDYHDRVLCDFLEFGFPIDYQGSDLDYTVRRNHKGARDFPGFISGYLQRECQSGRMAGPFLSEPFSVPLMVSPLNAVPKDDPGERRVIVDLSWPKFASVIKGISIEFYLNELILLRYASVEDMCRLVIDIGPGALTYKRDLRHAYRQFPVDHVH